MYSVGVPERSKNDGILDDDNSVGLDDVVGDDGSDDDDDDDDDGNNDDIVDDGDSEGR